MLGVVDGLLRADRAGDRHERDMHLVFRLLDQQLDQVGLRGLGHAQREDRRERLVDDRRRRDQQRGMRVRGFRGQRPQAGQEHLGRGIEAQIRNLEVLDEVLLLVEAEGAVAHASGVVDDDLRGADLPHGALERVREAGGVGDVGGVAMDGDGGGGRGDELAGRRQGVGRAREERNAREGVGREKAGDVRPDHGAGTDDEERPWGGHGGWSRVLWRLRGKLRKWGLRVL